MSEAQKLDIKVALRKAIQKVMDDQDSFSFLITESTATYMAEAALHVLDVTKDANDEWTDCGYLDV